MRLCVVGLTDDVSTMLLPAVQRMDGVELIGVMGTSDDRAAECTVRWGASLRIYRDVQELSSDAAVDVVMVFDSPDFTIFEVIDVLSAGKAVVLIDAHAFSEGHAITIMHGFGDASRIFPHLFAA